MQLLMTLRSVGGGAAFRRANPASTAVGMGEKCREGRRDPPPVPQASLSADASFSHEPRQKKTALPV
jgi:hypothetical protein